MGDIGDHFRDLKPHFKEMRQIKKNKFEPLLIEAGCIKKSDGVYEKDDWFIYPTKGFAMNKRKTSERMSIDKFLKQQIKETE